MPAKKKVDAGPVSGPELVIAVARPVGTPSEGFGEVLAGVLLAYGYTCVPVKLSGLLADQLDERGTSVDQLHEERRIHQLMDEGDATCRLIGDPAAVAYLGVNEIRSSRFAHFGAGEDQVALANQAVPRVAYVIDSVKRVAEVAALRSIYGDHLVVVGLQASKETRAGQLRDKVKPQRTLTSSERTEVVDRLIDRDLGESDDYGQNMLKTFPLADVFVNVEGDVDAQIRRVFDLLFGNPDYQVPSPDEYGMHLAYISSTRSPELGLKVGACILGAQQAVISLGVNAHPVPTGSPVFDSSSLDIRELLIDTLLALPDGALGSELSQRLSEDADAVAKELLAGDLKGSQLAALTEFQPTVHAEMSALIEAIRLGKDVSGSTMYVTAYPCHNCAKHLMALDINVVYLEPYPKSRTAAMYGLDAERRFVPFTGIAPRRYEALFTVIDDRKNPDGSRRDLTASEKQQLVPRINLLLDQRGIADREALVVAKLDETDPQDEDTASSSKA